MLSNIEKKVFQFEKYSYLNHVIGKKRKDSQTLDIKEIFYFKSVQNFIMVEEAFL